MSQYFNLGSGWKEEANNILKEIEIGDCTNLIHLILLRLPKGLKRLLGSEILAFAMFNI